MKIDHFYICFGILSFLLAFGAAVLFLDFFGAL